MWALPRKGKKGGRQCGENVPARACHRPGSRHRSYPLRPLIKLPVWLRQRIEGNNREKEKEHDKMATDRRNDKLKFLAAIKNGQA